LKKPVVIHPFLFAIFPILFLYAHNIDKSPPNEILLPIIITTCLAFLSWLLLNLILKDKKQAGLLVSIFLLLFFSYGHIYDMMSLLPFLAKIRHPITVLLFFSLLLLLGAFLLVKTRWNLRNFTSLFNIIAISLVAISLVNLGIYWFKTPTVHSNDDTELTNNLEVGNPETARSLPNVYYIILDGYARSDILEETYHYDNTDLLDYLDEKGFYVASRSSSNYAQTALSLASSLNLDYLDNLANEIGPDSRNRLPLQDMIQHNFAAKFLKRQGYLFVTFSSGYAYTEVRNADIFMTNRWTLSEFQNILLNTTPIPVLLDRLVPPLSLNNLHRKRILYTFDQLTNRTELESPVFVFAHILAPHPPFVFGENGEPVNDDRSFSLTDGTHYMQNFGADRDEYIGNYNRQLTFVNRQLIKTIDAIISDSPTPPIIILQADHGPGSRLDWENPDDTNTDFKERMSILNAYYLPDFDYSELHQEISPVNSFRVIFNHYFETNHALLTDDAFFSSFLQPYAFINVTNQINAGPELD
jgi:hypothetical protein